MFRGSHSAFQRGFTMVEIAICLAVIGFAFVAIIGVLPTGMQVQRDNREETIINQDGNYFMEAIRAGAEGLYELTNYVTEISVTEILANGTINQNPIICPNKILSGTNIIGALSTPQGWLSVPDCGPPNPKPVVYRTHAKVRSISGVAVEKGDVNTITFEYILTSEIIPFSAVDTNTVPLNVVTNLYNNLYDVRLTFRWPLMANGKTGTGRKVFRSLVSGTVERVDDVGYFFHPSAYSAAWRSP